VLRVKFALGFDALMKPDYFKLNLVKSLVVNGFKLFFGECDVVFWQPFAPYRDVDYLEATTAG
jgi:hypothetical protein